VTILANEIKQKYPNEKTDSMNPTLRYINVCGLNMHTALDEGQIQEVPASLPRLSERSRMRLLQALMGGPITVTELVEATDMTWAVKESANS
jgi:hypothetical protein